MSRPASVPFLLVAITLGSCKLARNEEQTGRDLPPPEPAASVLPSKPGELPSPPPRPRDGDRAVPRPAATPAEPTTKPTTKAEPTATTEPTAAAPTLAPTLAPTSTATGTAGAAPTLDTSCLPKCQSKLQGCVSKPPPTDGGLPSLESLAECRKAFDDCRKECGI